MSASTYPVRVDASLDKTMSRWLWLVKWVLAIPHFVVLAFLWVAFVALSIVAFFAILFTGRYPRSIFDFNVGVLRWTWRVQYYAYGALGTDRYPPFSLDERPDYPAHLDIDYPARLSRGLVLVKWWLLAIPHYIIVGLFVGGTYFGWSEADRHGLTWSGGGLIGILVLVAAVILLFTGRYPEPIFGFILGMNRWVLRVAAYAGLMTDDYPPFRLDLGGPDPGSADTGVQFQASSAAASTASTGPPSPTETGRESFSAPAPTRPVPGWTAGRVVSVVAGSVLAVVATGLLAGGAGVLAARLGHTQGGYVTSDSRAYSTSTHALVSETFTIPGNGVDHLGRDLIGTVRIRVTPTANGRATFVGLARAADVTRYLSGTSYTTVRDIGSTGSAAVTTPGPRTPAVPGSAGIWTASSAGPGTRTLTMHVTAGNWAVVVMNRNAAAGLAVRADIGARLPGLPWIATSLLAAGAVLLVAGVLLIVIPVRRTDGRPATDAGGTERRTQ